jgi:hypothetical protein
MMWKAKGAASDGGFLLWTSQWQDLLDWSGSFVRALTTRDKSGHNGTGFREYA